MSDDQRKLMYTKKGTGTVPKIKHRNNTSCSNQEERCPNLLSNNLGRDTDHSDLNRQYRNSGRILQYSYPMDYNPELNGVRVNGTIATNGTSTPNTSESNSRRNSVGTVPKCDNITKYPDKKQIEAKLSQIREYLRVTSSLMMNMKNTDDQSNDEDVDKDHLGVMIKELLDSEAKLVVMLDDIDNEPIVEEPNMSEPELSEGGFEPIIEQPLSNTEQRAEIASREIQMLKEQENLLLNLQLKAESQLREARMAQEKLAKGHQSRNTNIEPLLNGFNDSLETVSNSGGSYKNSNEITQMESLRDLEERLKGLNNENSFSRNQTNITDQNQIDSIQGRIAQMREGNDNRTQLIHMLDNRDMQLQAEHSALQGKLQELQNKKMQVDQLVLQLETMNEESEDEEVGNQVKKIVTMKQHLAKLKDMLDMVQNTQNSVESQNINESDVEEHVRRICSKTDNLMQNDVRSNHSNRASIDNNASARMENNTAHASNERRVREKQVNKKSMNANERETIKLQAELEAKKRELEELMCKHKAATSNLNHDVNHENKIDLSQITNPQFDGTRNLYSPNSSGFYNVPNSSDGFSRFYYPQNNVRQLSIRSIFFSDCPEDDINEYSEINSGDLQPMPVLTYPTTNYIKRPEAEPRLDIPSEQFVQAAARTPDRSIRSASVATPVFPRERARSNSNNDTSNKNQMQKQLELIRSVCDSMLDQTNNQRANVQVRNNLTPSPIYSEPRQYASPNANSMNALNIVNPPTDSQFQPMQGFTAADAGNYQNWLANNSLQTQAFMLNTLNQCCQMLWLQQRELTTLKSTVNMMQERYQNEPTFEPQQQQPPPNPISQYMHSNPCLFPNPIPNLPTSQSNSQFRTANNPKVIPAAVAGATSMPNLNHPPHCSQTNMEHAYANQCNLQNARVLDSALNNTVHNHQNVIGEHVNNSVLHNQALPSQIWNGQALNNQVAPGNRANNYWDNFRSYSRQNLLSTKSNELLQNTSTSTDRSNNSTDRSQPVHRSQLRRSLSSSSQTVPKMNRENHDTSTNTSSESTPRRQQVPVARQRTNAATIPPDVLNVNQIHAQQKINEPQIAMEFPLDSQVVDNAAAAFQPFLNSYSNESGFNPEGRPRNRNEWHDDGLVENNSFKSKLFEVLRENVYKEVASLISANQGRPHFLIQLFRDLQLISSDPLRRRALQSIQSVITHSLTTPTSSAGAATREMPSSQNNENDEIVDENASTAWQDFFMAPFCWPPTPRTKPFVNENGNIDTNGQEHLSEVSAFLDAHSEDIFSDSLVHSLKDLLVDSTFSAIFATTNTKDGIIQKHFASLLTEALDQFRGKKVQDVRFNVLQTVDDLLRGEISLIRLMRENISDDMNSVDSISTPPVQSFDLECPIDDSNVPLIQNADLAEADQSRIEIDEDDEGAVGGVLNILLERSSSSNAGQMLNEDNDIPKLDLVLNTESDIEYVDVEGLDQVPTRLTTNPTSRSNTPNKDTSRMEGPDHF